jgi:gamma-glutamylcyclotransferase (GGCT)/AIG2-like uncharacterized protein YtfP
MRDGGLNSRNTRLTVLFVYGTLRRGLRLHHHLQGTVYLGEARIAGSLHDIGTYPGLLVNPSPGWVSGELFKVDEEMIQSLDAVEEYNPEEPERSEYLRRVVTVWTPTGVPMKAVTYIFNRDVQGFVFIDSGDYKLYLEKG